MTSEISSLIIVLGSPNDIQGNLSIIAEGRINLAYKIWNDLSYKNCKFLLTGGFGDHFNKTEKPHAYYSKLRLIKLGVPESKFVEFAESVNTVDDALKSLPIVKKYNVKYLFVISSDFHIARVRFIFDRVFKDKEIQYFGAPYLDSVDMNERNILLDHEYRELTSLKEKGESIVGGKLSIF